MITAMMKSGVVKTSQKGRRKDTENARPAMVVVVMALQVVCFLI